MPRLKGTGKGPSARINIRLDEDVLAFYKRKANEHGVSTSEYLGRLLVQGVIAENVQEIEARLRGVMMEMQHVDGARSNMQLPDEVLLSVFAAENMLAAIVEAKDVQELYKAQDKAKAKLKKLKGG